MRRLADWHRDLFDWYERGGYIVVGAVYGLVYVYVFGGPLS